MSRKTKVMQQVLNPTGYGGVSVEYRALAKSKLEDEYEFIPLILNDSQKGINLHDIKYYYTEIRKVKPDILQVRGAAVDGLNAQIAVRLASPKTKVMLCVHGMYSDLVFFSRIKHVIAQYIVEPLCFTLANGISFVYKGAEKRKKLRRYRKKFIQFVYNRMPDYSDIDQQDLRWRFRRSFGIPDDAVVGLYCGRVTREKGIDHLTDAIEQVMRDHSENVFFVIVGDGDSLKEMKNRFDGNRNVVFTGAVSDVTPALSAADFFIQPSLHENHSVALLEAMAMKLPTIATDVGGNGEIVQDQRFGLLIEKGNTEQLTNAIVEMLKEKVRAGYKQAICAYDFPEFSNARVDEQLRRAYIEVMEK